MNSGTSRNSLSSQSSFYNQSGKNTSEFLSFKNTALEKGIQLQGAYAVGKNYHIENSELLVKFIRFENRMVRSVLENHQFTQTETHEWNLLWSSGPVKSYQYEGLNEY
jgi:hypothetical protein